MAFKGFNKFHKIKKTILVNLLFLLIPIVVFCQKGTGTKVITISNYPLKECIATNKHIWILENSGTIKRLRPEKYTFADSIKLNKKIVVIAKSKSDSVFVADEEGNVFIISENRDASILIETGQAIQHIIFSNENKCFLIADKGIYDLEKRKLYFEEDVFSNYAMPRFYSDTWRPSAVFIDKNDNIWLGFDGGEWGGDIVIFSINTNEFIKISEYVKQEYFSVGPVRSFFQVGQFIYTVNSLQHFSIRSYILEIHDTCRYIFQSPGYAPGNNMGPKHNLIESQELYLGPTIYNDEDKGIYFYCQFGVFKGNTANDLSKIENWSQVVRTNFLWYYGMPAAVGYSMNVSKMFFEKNKLFLVSPANGVLIWDGSQSVLLKTKYKPTKD